jgi:threonyl-tRNA synthetase
VRRLRPDAHIGFGPAIDDGFYYDFEVERPFTPEDLAAFEAEMKKVIQEKYPFVREEVSLEEARVRFAGDPLKLERLADFEGTDEVISVYTDGPFVDLCRGPHVPDTGWLKHFKLLTTAGCLLARRREAADAAAHLRHGLLEEGRARDAPAQSRGGEEARPPGARQVARPLPDVPGGARRRLLDAQGHHAVQHDREFVRERQQEAFQEIKTPLLYNKKLWEQSGHWGKYKENMFLVLDSETGEHDMSLKPMNCPSHHVYYGSQKHSYRELPVRYVTFDVLHRNELSGALSGLTRVRQFAQDDCHVYLREDQIATEVKFLMDFILGYYDTFGLTATLKFATRPGGQRIGSDELWDRAEAALRAALESTGRPYELKEGDGAFYGPKIDFDVTDSIGRAWQLGTIQLDYNAPERFDLSYTGEDNAPHRPVVIHRAVSGSFERFIAILIEHFAGAFPVWLATEQVRVIPIAIDYNDHAQAFVDRNSRGSASGPRSMPATKR